MKIKEAIQILKLHNVWRRGAKVVMIAPKELGEAMDTIISHYEGSNLIKSK